MQAALYYFKPSTSFPRLTPTTTTTKTIASPLRSTLPLQTTKCSLIRVAAAPQDNPTVDYSSMTSVFPAEACETVGGDACDVEMYPEVKLNPEPNDNTARTNSEAVDREYLEYSSPKTVFPGEACDDLGGEFCDPEYQKGVY